MNLVLTFLLITSNLTALWSLWQARRVIKLTKAEHGNKKLAIVIPFDEKHLIDVQKMIGESWRRFPPEPNNYNIELFFYFSGELALKPKVHQTLKQLPVPLDAFRRVNYISANIAPEEDTYPLATSLMFFRLFNHPLLQRSDAIMWMEPDVYPCQRNWLTHLYLQAFTGPSYWIKGSMQRAAPDNDGFLAQADHINGNALYYRNSLAFLSFLNQVAELFAEDPQSYIGSFDVGVWVVFRHERSYAEYADLRTMYAYTDFIQNYYVRSVNATELCVRNKETYLVHGRNVFF